MAKIVIEETENNESRLQYIYDIKDSIKEKISKIATNIYGASAVEYSKEALEKISKIEDKGYCICIAKTPSSFSDNPKLLGRPTNFVINIKDIKVNNGAGFVVAYAGNILTMPGLGKNSNYEKF